MSEEIAVIGVAMPTDGVEKGIKALDTLAGTGAKVEKAMDGIDKAAAKTGKSLATLGQGNGTGLGKVVTDTTAAAAGVKKISDAATEAESGLKKIGTTANTAAGQLGKMEISAKQTAAALRGVPAQFTDIITSLQGGQAPLTVLLQQGGQLKDMFGGVGNAARALGGYVVGLVNPFTVAAAAAGTLAVAYHQGSEEARAFQNAVTITGGAVGVSSNQFAALAQSISSISGTRGKASEVLTEIASTGKLAGSEIKGIAEAAILMEKATGQAVSKTIAEFVKLSDEPAKASVALNKQYNYLTTSVYEQIKALEEQGKKTQAAELAEKSYADALKIRTMSVVDNAGLMEKAWRGITGSAKGAWDAMLDVGRPTTNADQIETLERQLRDRRARNSGLGIKDGAATRELQDQIAALKETVRLEQRSTDATAERARIQAAGAAAVDTVAKANERAASKQEQLNKALKEYRDGIVAIRAANPESALLDPKKIAAAEAGIRDQFKGSAAKDGLSEAQRSLASYVTELQKRIDKEEELTEVQKAQNELSSLGTFGQIPQVRELLLERAKTLDVLVAEEAATKAAVRSYNDYQVAQQRILDGYKQSADAAEKSVQKYADEEAAVAIAAAKNISLAEAIEEVELARVRETRVKELAKGADGATLLALQKEIEAREKIKGFVGRKESREAATEAAKASAAEWKRGWEETDRIGRDVFTSWATDGSNAAKKIGDTLKKALLSAIYEVTLQPLVKQIYISVVGGQPTSTAGALANAAGGSGGGSGLLGLFGSAGGLFGSGFKAGLSAVFGESGTLGAFSAGTTAIGAGNVAGGLGTLAGAAAPWITGAMLLKSLTDYKVESRGSGLTATVGGATGLPSGSVGMFQEFQQTGGLGGGGTTINRDWSVADQGVATYITKNVQAITASNRAYADALGLSSESINTFTKNIEVSLTGLDAAGQQAAIDQALSTFAAEQAAATYGDALASVALEGETTTQTLQRLGGSITGANSSIASFGGAMYSVSVAGASAAAGLVSAFGSLQNMQAQISQAVSNYATPGQQQSLAFEAGAADLSSVGINVTAADLRNLTREQIATQLLAYQRTAAASGATEDQKRFATAVSVANRLSGYVPGFAAAAPDALPPRAPVEQVGSSGGGGGGGAVSSAAENVVSAWQEAADAIIATMTDIRSASLEVGPDSFANIKAQFAIEIAKAGSGDLAALQDLPALAKTLNSAGEANSKNAVEQALLTSYILDSLGRVSGAGYADSGLTAPNYTGAAIPSATGPTQVYVPSVYIPPSFSQGSSSLTDAGVAEVFKKMEERLEAIEKSNELLRKMFFNATDGGSDYINSKAV